MPNILPTKASKPFAVFDIDGTLIRWQLYHAVADALVRFGYFDPVKFEEVKQARMLWKRRTSEESFSHYEHRLVKAYEEVLKTLTVAQFEEAAEQVFEEYKDQVYTYTRQLITDLKKRGYLLFAISGSQAEIVEKIVRYYGFDDYIGSHYETAEGHFTGKIETARFAKDKLVKRLAHKHGCDFKDSVAAGDSESDIPMLSIVENPIAFNPTKSLFAHAKQQAWPIVIERKNVIYKLEPKGEHYILA